MMETEEMSHLGGMCEKLYHLSSSVPEPDLCFIDLRPILKLFLADF